MTEAEHKKLPWWKKISKALGPGFITGASDDDPSGIGTYSQTGAQFGHQQLWAVPLLLPFMTTIQEICGRIGLVTGKGIAQNIKEHYPKQILYLSVSLLLIANIINIGADLGAMAASAEMLLGIPYLVWLVIITAVTLLAEILIPYKTYARYLKYLTIALFCYIIAAFAIKLDWKEILVSSVVPQISFTREYILNFVALMGTTISPYLFFWQSAEEIEERIAEHKIEETKTGRPRITKRDIRDMRLDTFVGMFFSNLIMFFIMITTASTLHVNGVTKIETAHQAAQALQPFAGQFAFIFFAAGIIGTGLLAVPVLAGSASYALSETFNWKTGLYRKFSDAKGFYGIIIVSTLIGLCINFTPIKPFQLLYYTAIINGVISPPLMILIMRMSNNKKIMGSHVNSRLSNVLGWIITIVMSVASIALVASLFI